MGTNIYFLAPISVGQLAHLTLRSKSGTDIFHQICLLLGLALLEKDGRNHTGASRITSFYLKPELRNNSITFNNISLTEASHM